jgi:iron complex outermembrane receptor protein
LIDIDGVPLSNDGIARSGNPLSFINPNHIESFTVLSAGNGKYTYTIQ